MYHVKSVPAPIGASASASRKLLPPAENAFMQYLLVIFGWAFILAMVLALLVQFIRRRSDLLTAWNLFLVGSLNFVGIAAIQSGTGVVHYGIYSDDDYAKFVLGAIVFYVMLFLVYHFWKYPRRAAGRRWRKWPRPTRAMLLSLLPICALLALLSALIQIQGAGQIAQFIGENAPILGVAYVIVAWYRQPWNVPVLGILVGFTTFAIALALAQFG